MFAVDKVEMTLEQVAIGNDEDDDDDDDDDDDEDEAEAKEDDVNFDPFGNIREKFNANDLPATFATVGDGSQQDAARMARAFPENFKKFQDEHMKDSEEYPRNERFLSIVDRRRADKKKETVKDDEVIFFAPPPNCKKLPNPVHPFYFFDTARSCIVPEEDYTKKYNEAQESGSKPDVPSLKTLTSMNMKKGLMV